MNKIVIDGDGAILGRLASYAAKQALLGKNVAVLNCENIVISGVRVTTLAEYRTVRARGGHAQKGPYFPTQPAMIVKRTIRGMLSHREGRGAAAFKRIRCYEGIPKEFAESKKEKIKKSDAGVLNLKELSEELR